MPQRNKMDFVYINGAPKGHYENELAAQGWRWIRTNTIAPTPFNTTNTTTGSEHPNRLNPHFHHGLSTHMVVSGDLYVQRHGGSRAAYEISDFPGAKRQDLVPPGTTYSGSSERGCTFVEAHKCLSPQTAERLIDRGTLKLVKKHGTTWRYPEESDLKAWLRTVKFNPDGKAHSNRAKGEKPILDTSHVQPPIPDDFLDDLSEWFAEEWQRPAQGVSPILLAVIFAVLAWVACRIFAHRM
ncbi:hypothetical protein GGR58DRAFT_522301 [Xylaria digitata]|nr:hypothetical protein GGR58DRAFT_522301 [Xylaria digitata]